MTPPHPSDRPEDLDPCPSDTASDPPTDPATNEDQAFDEWVAEMNEYFGSSKTEPATEAPSPPPPDETARNQAIAAYLQGRVCIYLEKRLLSPVQVESTSFDSRIVRAVCLTRPWDPGQEPRRFSVGMPVDCANAFSIELSGGYGLHATFVHAPEAVAAFERWARDGGDPNDMDSAVRYGLGLPPEVAELLHQPFDPGASAPPSDGDAGLHGRDEAGVSPPRS